MLICQSLRNSSTILHCRSLDTCRLRCMFLTFFFVLLFCFPLVGACKSYFVALVLLSLRSVYDVNNNNNNNFRGVRRPNRTKLRMMIEESVPSLHVYNVKTIYCMRICSRVYVVCVCFCWYISAFAIWISGPVAQRVERWTYDQQVVGSNLTRGNSCITILASCSHLCASISKQHNLVPV